jgi:hypothetical protein
VSFTTRIQKFARFVLVEVHVRKKMGERWEDVHETGERCERRVEEV